jgi:hypothetical protein
MITGLSWKRWQRGMRTAGPWPICVSCALSELHPRHSVITVDREDFKLYRRNKREAIPIVCPPGS